MRNADDRRCAAADSFKQLLAKAIRVNEESGASAPSDCGEPFGEPSGTRYYIPMRQQIVNGKKGMHAQAAKASVVIRREERWFLVVDNVDIAEIAKKPEENGISSTIVRDPRAGPVQPVREWALVQ